MYIKRTLETRLKENLDRDEIIVLIGTRQSGKTTLLKRLTEILTHRGDTTFFINLESSKHLQLLNENPENLFKLIGPLPSPSTSSSTGSQKTKTKTKSYVFIDEIQYLENPSNFLKYIFDEYKGHIKLIVSGSSAFYIDQKFSDSLAGRKRLFQLNLLNFKEFLRFKESDHLSNLFPPAPLGTAHEIPELKREPLNHLMDEFIRFGGYPGVVLEKSEKEKKYLLEELFNSYLAKDVEVLGIRKKEKFYALLKLLAMQTGSLVNVNELANTLAISVTAVDNYLYILEKSFQVKKLRPFFENLRKELTRMPKLFFMDMGIRNIILDNFELLETRMDSGSYFENVVFKLLNDRDDIRELFFWRTQTRKEIDFIVDRKWALEAKLNGSRFEPGKYKTFTEHYTDIPLRAIAYRNVQEGQLSLFDLL